MWALWRLWPWASFTTAHVFDISQTSGPDLPDEIRPTLLEGEAPAGAWDQLAAQVAAAGYSIERYRPESGANGFTDPIGRRVVVRDDVDDAQAFKTLCHELGHIVLGHVDASSDYQGCRGRCETEAESVAFVVAAALGLSTDSYSFPYVGLWSGGDVEMVRRTASAVTAAARTILAALATSQTAEAVAS
jgi:hypothetical protein